MTGRLPSVVLALLLTAALPTPCHQEPPSYLRWHNILFYRMVCGDTQAPSAKGCLP